MPRAQLIRTRVGAHVSFLFLVGAVIPVVVLAIISFRAVSSQLVNQAEDRLGQVAHAAAQLFAEPLDRLDGELLISGVVPNHPLWAAGVTLLDDSSVSDWCVMSGLAETLTCRHGTASRLQTLLPPPSERVDGAGVIRFRNGDDMDVAAWREVEPGRSTEELRWYLVVSETQASIGAPIVAFKARLMGALLISLGLVLLAANLLVRRTMEPLGLLTAGAARIALLDLTTKVDIKGDDEFSDLARVFNSMATRLSRQFHHLETAKALDRAVIEASGVSVAVAALIDGLGEVLPTSKSIAVLLFDVDDTGRAARFHRDGAGGELQTVPSEAGEFDRSLLPTRGAGWLREPEAVLRHFRDTGVGVGHDHVFVAPLVVQETVVGIAALGSDPLADPMHDDLKLALQLIDKGAVALDELRLRRELEELSWEALRALGNTIDAKSKWTAGHSERVTDLARAIGVQMDLGTKDLETLFRGGLLHDIGNIGVPLEILDYPGELDTEMREIVEAHPVEGARILGPIRIFQRLLPIVRHHHERWNGSGYPEGLRGEKIPRLARILAVADVFDAMLSARSYRVGMSQDEVFEYVQAQAGQAFDPEVVAAFDQVMADGWIHDVVREEALRHV